MAHSNQHLKTDKRKEDKIARKRENIAKVESTKREKTMWEKLSDERAGIKSSDTTTDGEATKKVRLRTRKVLTKNRRSHHHGHGHQSPTVHVQMPNGEVMRVKRARAAELVAKSGAQYVSKTIYRQYMAKQNETNG